MHRQFPNASEDDWELLIPKKQDIYLMQAKLKDGDSVVIYSNDQDPLFFGYDDSELFPSLYALWKCPSIVKPIYTPPAVSQFVLNGADLMLPGVLEDPQDAFQKNEKRCVLVRGNTKAICVGTFTTITIVIFLVRKNGMFFCRGRKETMERKSSDCLSRFQ